MNKKKSNKNLPKYLFGTKVSDEDLLSDYLYQRQMKKSNNPGTIEHPGTALAQNNIAMARAEQEAANNPWSIGLDIFGSLALQTGTSMMNQGITNGQGVSESGFDWGSLLKNGIGSLGASSQVLAYGGDVLNNIPVEVEGDEVGETPYGELLKFFGPSHENGGIDVALPEGTDMYSKRIKVNGTSMADRKMKREKHQMKIESMLDDNSTDSLLKDTLSRTKSNNEMQDNKDMNIQEMIKLLLSNSQKEDSNLVDINDKQKFQGGGTVFGDFLRKIFGGKDKESELQYDENGILDLSNVTFKSDNASLDAGMLDIEPVQGITDFSYDDKILPGEKQVESKNIFNDLLGEFGDATLGDMIGLFGDATSTFGPMKNTLANRAGDTPNINAFKEFGKDGLESIDKAKGLVKGIADENLQDIELARASNVKRNRNSARGVNTQRALDVASTLGANNSATDVYSNLASQLMQLIGQEAQMENQQDQVVMSGEQQRDLADRQDRDNFFSQMAEDISTKGQGLQQIGKDINDIRERQMMMELLNQLSKYGVTFDNKGKLQNPKN